MVKNTDSTNAMGEAELFQDILLEFSYKPFKVVEVKGGWQVKFWDFDLEIFPRIIAKNIVLQNTP